MIFLTAALALVTPHANKPCTVETAVRTTVTAIGENLDRYLDRCVTVSGPASSIALFSSVEGVYRAQRRAIDGRGDPKEGRQHRLGLYSDDDVLRKSNLSNLTWLTVTGRVDSCERKRERALAEAGEDIVVMMLGYCHSLGGAVIDAVGFSVDPGRTPQRLVGEPARSRVGDLVQAPDDWLQLSALRRLAADFRAALRKGDRRALAEMHDIGADPDARERALLEFLIDRPDSPFAQVRRNRAVPMAIFIRRSEIERARARLPVEAPFGTICLGRRGDRRRAWPISADDADNDPERPYACTDVGWPDDGRGTLRLYTRLDRAGGLAEPSRLD